MTIYAIERTKDGLRFHSSELTASQSMSDAIPCPFCGSVPEVSVRADGLTVDCRECRITDVPIAVWSRRVKQAVNPPPTLDELQDIFNKGESQA